MAKEVTNTKYNTNYNISRISRAESLIVIKKKNQ